MPPRQTLKVTIYAGAGDATRDFSHASIQRSSLCGLLAASALSQNGFSVTLVGPQDIQKGEGITISLTSSLRRLLTRLHLLADHDGDATTLDLHDLRARVLTKVNEEAQLFRYIATDSPASFETSSSASSPTLLLTDGTSVKNDVLLCCDPSPSLLSCCVSLPSSPSQVDARSPVLLFYDVPWSVTHRAIFGPAAYSVGNEERQSPSSFSALDLSQWLLDALSLSFVLTQAAIPHAVGVALQVYSDVRREHLRSLAELTETGERLDEETLEGFLDKDWLAELEDSWSRRYLSNI
ncbi:hypothetical protein BCV69DRAFT_282978 [Microstroma glucosiphilum]|uniref:Uncharacterized protein n=1 Tax=Pseudomicrostroma glucosiphilum TaxID=1684307 RepID=A0A316U685_9BASI|nr:hypothetical protein BCV69DRAFT_282978 [Pseudomicrostroma glucosiphilum]PWN20756.1 hypothetical protein BCV69DRAFT_282978 [Pseudomicrostroma glucosiphilum]